MAVSLLLSEGHLNATRYALAKVWYEAQIVRERVNNRIATEVTLMHTAMVAIMSPKGKGVTNLNKQLKRLQNGD